MPVKKGLVAPQNIFIQTIIKKFDGSPDRNFVLGNAQVVDLPIIYCNDGFCDLTGYTRAELVQKHCSCDFLCGEDTSESAARAVKEALRGTEEKHVEILYYKKDGSQFLCSVLVAPIKSEDGMAAMYIVNHEDVTWSPNKDDVTLPRSCFQFPLNMNKIPSAIRRKKHGSVLGADEEDEDSTKSSRALDTHIASYSSSGNSDLNSPDSPSCVPVMSVLPPSPPVSSEVGAELSSPLSSPEKSESSMGVLPQKASSLFDVSKASNTESESLIKPMQSIGYSARTGNMLYIPEFKGRLSAACSESAVWNARGRPWSDGHNVDLRGSTIITSPVLNIHPRKTEKVAQVMSLGADVLPEYKLQAPKIHPWTILHYSPFKAFWDWLILFLVIYTAIVTPYVASFVLSRDKLREKLNKDPETRRDTGPASMYSDPLVIVDYIVDVMFIVDIFINFRTTFVDSNDEVVSHPCRIAIHYCKTWFVIDLVAAIPFELLIMIGDTDQTATLIGLLKTARLLRLVRVARKLDHYSEYGMAVLCLLMCSFALLAHWLACIWYFIGTIERGGRNTTTIGWLDSLATQINQPYNASDEMSGPDLKSKYVTALYFTLSSLTSVGFGNVSPNTNIEKMFSICIMLVGSLFYAAIFGNVAAIIARLYSTTSRYHAQMQKVREFIRFYQIPNPLRQRVEDYAHHVWSYTNGIDMDQVLKNFPECLQADICLHLNSGLLHCYPAFSTAPQGCLRALALRIRTTHLPPGDYIVYQGDEISHLYFVLRGTVEVLDNDVIMAILSKGDSFGEDFVSDPDRPVTISSASIRALTYCDLRMISREDVLRILGQYPSYRDSFIRDLEVTFNLRRSSADMNSATADRNSGCHASSAASPAPAVVRVNGPVNGPVVNNGKKNGTAPKQGSQVKTNLAVRLEMDTPPTSSTSSQENGAKSLASQLRELNASLDEREKRRSQSCQTNSNHVEATIEPANCFSSGHHPGECCSSVCKDCCSSFREMQAKLDNLSSCLQRLETTLSADVEAIFGLLRTYNEAIKDRKLDFHTQV